MCVGGRPSALSAANGACLADQADAALEVLAWVELSWDNGLTAHKHHVGCFSAKQWFVFNGQWPIIRCTKLYSKLKKQCKLNYRNKHHNSSLHMKQNSKLFALCEMPLHHRHSAGLDSSHHIMQIICLAGITVQQWWLLHCYPRGSPRLVDRRLK